MISYNKNNERERSISYKYDHYNNRIEKLNDNGGSTKYGYDSKGNRVMLRGWNVIVQFKYDTLGNVVEYFYTDTLGNLIHPIIILIEPTFTIKDEVFESPFINDSVNTFIQKHDIYGNIIEHISYSAKKTNSYNKNEINNITRWKYDTKGNIIEISSYDKNNNLYNQDFMSTSFFKDIYMNYVDVAIIRKKYDNQKRLIEESFYGADEKLKESGNSQIACVRYYYDENGKIKNKICFNKQMKEVTPPKDELFREYMQPIPCCSY